MNAQLTHDTLLRGRVKLIQPARGFRSSLDPVLLAGFVRPPFGRFLDIGCGTGALSFLLLAHDPKARGVGIEIQPRLAALAERAAVENGWAESLRVVAGDVRRVALDGPFDLVATNPPFRPLGTGRLPPDQERALAHHEVALTLDEWIAVADRHLAADGRIATIFPAYRLYDLRGALGRDLRLRFVIAQPGAEPKRVLVEARKGRGRVTVEAPLLTHDGGRYSAEVRRMLGEV